MDINPYKKYEPIDGKWYFDKVLGKGGFGTVFEIVRKDFPDIRAALKIISIPASQSEIQSYKEDNYDLDEKSVTSYFYSFVEEFIEEFTIMSQLKGHSNIVSYEDHDIIKHEEGIGWDIFIRMELLTPMNRYFASSAPNKKSIIKLGIDICKALEVCRKYNIIHRDIKPSNIFISKTNDFKLGDFGVARTLEKTSSGLSKKGTYSYMAPEVYKGEEYGPSVDIYSLGIVMYRLLNNNLEPFRTSRTHSDEENAMVLRLKGEAPLPAPANATGKLAEIILKACAFEPKNRYENPTLMREELESILNSYDSKEAENIPEINSSDSEINNKTVSILSDINIPPENIVSEKKEEETIKHTIPEENPVKQPTPISVPYENESDKTVSILADKFVPKKEKAETPEYTPFKLRETETDTFIPEDIPEPKKEENDTAKKSKTARVISIILIAIMLSSPLIFIFNLFKNSSVEQTGNEIIAVSAGNTHTVGLKNDGTVVAVGQNAYGQCDVSDREDIIAISAGGGHTVGLKNDGTVVAVGYNEYDQCDASEWKDIIAISAVFLHTVGLKKDGTVVAVGYNEDGQCDVSDWKDIIAISAGSHHTVGLKKDGTVVAVGYNYFGQCDVSDWKDIIAVSAVYNQTVGLKKDGTVVAVGDNEYGQCDVSEWKDIIAISAGDYHTVGLKNDGTVVAVGDNYSGRCDVSDWNDIIAISADSFHTVGLKKDGTVVAVGENDYGQCDVSDWKDIIAISAGDWHTIGLKKDGTVVAVGNNAYGQCDVEKLH